MNKASLTRRTILGKAVLLLSTAGFASPVVTVAYAESGTSGSFSGFQSKLDDLASRAQPGSFGAVVLDFNTGESWGVNADHAFPMMSVFKAPLGAAVLAKVDAGEMSLQQTIAITRADLRLGASKLAEDFKGDSMTFTVEQLLGDAVSRSDNTAADMLVKLVGGPHAVTDYLRAHDITGMRVDLDEGGVEHIFSGLGSASQPPANETAGEKDERLWRGYQAYLADPRNRSTPAAATDFLRMLWNGELLSAASTKQLLDLLYAQTTPARLRAGLPEGVRLADKCGTSISLRGVTAAFNDIGILTWPDGHTVIISAFLTASQAPQAERQKLFVALARATAATLHP